MNQDIVGAIGVGLRVGRNQGLLGGFVGGVPAPIRMTGTMITPHWSVNYGTGTTTAGRLYYYPIYIDRIETWLGVKSYNGGTGDSGEVYRVGIYTESSSGGPGSLGKDFGEVTLSGASALRTLTSSWTPTYIGWHYIAIHHNTAASMYYLCGSYPASAAGYEIPGAAFALGTLETTGAIVSDVVPYICMYVDTTYGALASTAVAPTNGTKFATAVALYK